MNGACSIAIDVMRRDPGPDSRDCVDAAVPVCAVVWDLHVGHAVGAVVFHL